MKANTPIHLVIPKIYEALNDIYAVFDSKEKATQFVDKFKNRPDMEIIDRILNPDYNVDKTAPNYRSLAQTGRISGDIFMCDYNLDVEDRQEEYNIYFYGGSKSSQGAARLENICYRLKRSIEKREWDLAWEKYKLQQSGLKFNRLKKPVVIKNL